MRIAFSGAHATGKTTLIAELRHRLPRYLAVEEPYYALLEEGHRFADAPLAEDLEAQLARSLSAVGERAGDRVLFDRSPADYLAYLHALGEGPGAGLDAWIPPALQALRTLHLVVFVPVERPDRIDRAELPRLRRRVDALLREIWIEDGWGFGADVLEVRGTVTQRTEQVLARLARHAQDHG